MIEFFGRNSLRALLTKIKSLKVSTFENDAGYLTAEDVPEIGDADTLDGKHASDFVLATDSRLTDARPASDVSAWAKAATKPSYTAAEVGALPSTTTIPTNTNQLTNGAGFITASAIPTSLPANGGSADSAGYTRKKTDYSFNSSTLPNSFNEGISAGFVADNSGYGSYGSVLNVRTYSSGGGSLQLYAPYSPTYGGTRLKARFGNFNKDGGNSWTDLKEIAWTSDIPSAATTSAAGLMSAADKTKLNGIATGATANTGTVTSVAVKVNGAVKGTVTSSGTIDLGTLATTNSTSGSPAVATQAWRNVYAGTADLTAGTSALTTGTIYCVYE